MVRNRRRVPAAPSLDQKGCAMSAADDVEFFRRRSDQERALARDTDVAAIRRLHLDLAERYTQRLREAVARKRANAAARP
jgi:hypothetical protein